MLPIAGGTDILIKMRKKRPQNVHLLSLKDVEDLFRLYEDEAGIHIGPMLTFSHLAQQPLIEKKRPFLKTAALAMGGPQIQNLATIGGNVCNGATSADSAAPLHALNAHLVLARADGRRSVPITEFYLGPGRVARMPNELLTDIIVPPVPVRGFYGVYKKFATRKAMDIATLGCIAIITLNDEGCISDAALAYCTAGPIPVRCVQAGKELIGTCELDETLLDHVAEIAAGETHPRTSWRASKEYRLNLIRELGKRAIVEAFEKARETL